MANKDDAWQQANAEIVSRVDIRSEYERYGVKFVGSPSAKGWLSCHSPFREDNKPSAAVNVGDGPLRGRFKDLGGDGASLGLFDFIAKQSGSDWKRVRADLAKQVGVSLPRRKEDRWEEKATIDELIPELAQQWAEAKGGIDWKAVMRAGGRMLMYPKKAPPEKAQILIGFPAWGGSLFDMPPNGMIAVEARAKKVSIFQGQGKPPRLVPVFNMGQKGMMNRHALTHLRDAKEVHLTEGVSDMLCLESWLNGATDRVVISCGGATMNIEPGWLKLFAGKRVFLWGDCDEPGQNWISVNSALLLMVTTEVFAGKLPYDQTVDHGKDLRDWFRDGHNLLDFDKLCEQAEKIVAHKPEEAKGHALPAPTDAMAQLLANLGCVVLGRHEDSMKVEVYSRRLGITTPIRDINRFSFHDCILAFGLDVSEQFIYDGIDAPPPGQATIRFLRNSIGAEASKINLIKQASKIGLGAWPVSDDSLALINVGGMAVWNGKASLERCSNPLIFGHIADPTGDAPWYDHDEIADLLIKAADPEWRIARFNDLINVFRQWENWAVDRSPELMAALVNASWVQRIWPWRPQVMITGRTQSGKSSLIGADDGYLPRIFGAAAITAGSSTTAAGLRQEMSTSARVVFFDEFDKCHERERIFDMARQCGAGGYILKGTTHQKVLRFFVKSLMWFAGIDSGLVENADLERFIRLELKGRSAGSGKRIPALNTAKIEELRYLGQCNFASMIFLWKHMVRVATHLARVSIAGFSTRQVESFAAPTAVISAILGLGPGQTTEMLQGLVHDFLGHPEAVQDNRESDEDALIEAILSSSVNALGQHKTVIELISSEAIFDGDFHEADKILRRVGIVRNCTNKDGSEKGAVFISPNYAQRYLLKGTRFQNSTIKEILMRIPGAESGRHWINGHNTRGIYIPSSVCSQKQG